MGSLQLKSIRKTYGTHEVLKGIDLEVKDGEFVIFVGPSGCGKSTLLRSIAGLEDVTSGAVLINGKDETLTPPAKRGIAMVFQSYALYPHLTVKDNMGLGLKQAGTPKDEIDKRVTKASVDAVAGTLSGRGARQSFPGASASVSPSAAPSCASRRSSSSTSRCPTSMRRLRVQTRLEIARLHRSLKATMIYVTHDQVEAMTLADKIVVLNAGAIEQVGSPMELYNRPANVFVAGFIGSPKMNFIPGDKVADAGAKTVGVRPEHLALSREQGTWRAKVVHVEHLGADTIIYLESEQCGLITARLFGEHKYEPDEIVYATPDTAHMHRFDANDQAIR